MNEVQLIRRELAAQREHAREVGASWSSCLEDFKFVNSVTYYSYFSLILGLESKRIESHLERLRPRADLSEEERQRLARCAREFETHASARALASMADSAPAVTASTVARSVESLTRLSTVVEELEAIAESRYRVDDWRRASHVDADSSLEERRLRKLALGEARGPAGG
ncbi:MAG TPA: hypothetical protein VEV18_03325 [Steroidobacteraceae bacterium]|nr:hypothetical protein [Steroidobacteraceae bacterium]